MVTNTACGAIMTRLGGVLAEMNLKLIHCCPESAVSAESIARLTCLRQRCNDSKSSCMQQLYNLHKRCKW